MNNEEKRQTLTRNWDRARPVIDSLPGKYVNLGFGARKNIEALGPLSIADDSFFYRAQAETGWFSGTDSGVRLSLER